MIEPVYRCLLDMDGVLVDFVSGACKLHGRPSPYPDPRHRGGGSLQRIWGMSDEEFAADMGEEFWANLPPMPQAFDLAADLERLFGREKVCILSKPVETPGCAEGKLRWLRKWMPDYSRRFLLGPRKEFAASATNVLVDDSEFNVNVFNHAGGIGVLDPAPWNMRHGDWDRPRLAVVAEVVARTPLRW